MWLQINQWWLALESRERNLLSVLGVFLLLVLLYLLLWKPIMKSQQAAQQKLQNAQNTWQWLNEQVPLVEQLSANKSSNIKVVNSQGELLRLLQRSLREQNLFKDIKSVKGTTKGAEVRFEEVPAARLLRWLGTLEQRGIVAAKLQMEALAADKVKARIDFEVAG